MAQKKAAKRPTRKASSKKAAKRPTRPKKQASKARPKCTLGSIADEVFELRTERLKLEAEVAAIKAEEADLKAQGLKLLVTSKLQMASGNLATISRTPKLIATVIDWDKLWQWVHKKKETSIFQKSVAQGYVGELNEAGKLPPGIRMERVVKISITAAKRG